MMLETTYVEASDEVRIGSSNLSAIASRGLEVGLLGTLLLAPLPSGSVPLWAQFGLQCAAALLLVLWALKQTADGAIRIRPNTLLVPLLVLGTLPLLQLAFGWSAYVYATRVAWLLWVAYGILFFVASQTIRHSSAQKLFVNALSIFGFLVALFGIAQYLTSNGKIYWFWANPTGSFFFGPYVNHSHYAGLMELLIPIPLMKALSRKTRNAQGVLFGFAAVTMIVSVMVSQSMGGMIAVAAELVAVILVFGKKRLNLRNLLTISGIGALILLYAAVVDGSAVVQRLMSNSSNAVSRWAILKDTIHMSMARPVTGWGLNTFESVYPQFQSFYTSYVVNAAHNDYAQVLAELGLIGFAALATFITLLYRRGWKNVLGWRSHEVPSFAVAALIGCTGLLIHSFGDFNMQIPANASLFFVLAAVASGRPDVIIRSPRMVRTEDVD